MTISHLREIIIIILFKVTGEDRRKREICPLNIRQERIGKAHEIVWILNIHRLDRAYTKLYRLWQRKKLYLLMA